MISKNTLSVKELGFTMSWVFRARVILTLAFSRTGPAILMEPVGSIDDLVADTAWLGFHPAFFLLFLLFEVS